LHELRLHDLRLLYGRRLHDLRLCDRRFHGSVLRLGLTTGGFETGCVTAGAGAGGFAASGRFRIPSGFGAVRFPDPDPEPGECGPRPFGGPAALPGPVVRTGRA